MLRWIHFVELYAKFTGVNSLLYGLFGTFDEY